MHSNVQRSIIYNCWGMLSAQVSINRWMNKDVVSISDGLPFSYSKGWNFAMFSNMDGLGRYYAKWNASDRGRQILYDITYMWNLNSTMGNLNKQTKKNNNNKKRRRLTNTENKLVVTSVEKEGESGNIGVEE